MVTVAGRAPDPDGWLEPDEQDVWRRLLTVHAQLIERLDEDLRRGHGLALADYDVLVSLAEGPGEGLRMRELAGRVMLSPSGLTRRVDRLVERSLVRRELCPSDGRGALAILTDDGAAALAAAAPTHVGGVRRILIGPLGPGGTAALGTALRRIAGALDPAAPGARPPPDGTEVEP